MKNYKAFSSITLLLATTFLLSCNKEAMENFTPDSTEGANLLTSSLVAATYTMPDENKPHEGTWLQWPHHYQYGMAYRDRLDATWVAMTRALVQSEKVHIVAYNATEKTRITGKLSAAGVPLTNVNFHLFQTNDVWARDNNAVFVKDASGALKISDWGFNGWGNKTPYTKDNVIPAAVSTAINIPTINLNSAMVLEGGAYEIDGKGVFLACKSSILNANRNPNMTQVQAETILKKNLGVTKFIWLNGVAGLDVTDMHIDGFAKFANENTLVTMNNTDLLYWEVPQADINTLYAAKKVNNTAYNRVYLPLTKNDVVTTYGKNLGYKGSYVNYYVGNTRVLVPNYNDANDAVANSIIQGLYPGRTVVGIDVRNLYENGGMVHCVTQQQPL